MDRRCPPRSSARSRSARVTLVPARCPKQPASSSRSSADGPAQRVRGHAAPDRASRGHDATIPQEKRPKPERFHGRHVLNRYEDGMEKCIGCELCAGVCPAKCIYVRGADNPTDDAGVAGRALRLRLRDQLPPLHPLRPVRRGVPDRGDHRDASSSSSRSPTATTRSTPRTSCSSTTTAAPAGSRGSCGSAARTTTRARGCAPPSPSRPGGVRRPRRLVGRARLRRAPARGRAVGHRGRGDSREPAPTEPVGTVDDRARRPLTHDRGDLLRLRARSALVGALGVVLARNPVHSALFLVLTLVSVAVLFLQQDAQLVAAVQIVVYAERDRRAVPVRDHAARRRPARVARRPDAVPARRPRSCSACSLLAEVLVPRRPPLGHRRKARRRGPRSRAATAAGNVETRRASLFTDFLWAFEITAVLLVIAVVGGVVLARRSGQPGR